MIAKDISPEINNLIDYVYSNFDKYQLYRIKIWINDQYETNITDDDIKKLSMKKFPIDNNDINWLGSDYNKRDREIYIQGIKDLLKYQEENFKK